MLNNISWQGYWVALALLTACYYLFLYLRYFRGNGETLFQQRKQPVTSPSVAPAVASFLKEQTRPSFFVEEVGDEFSTPTDPTEQGVYACMDEITAYFASAKKGKVMKAEVMFAVQHMLQKYPSLPSSEYKESISKIIQTDAEHHCSVHLSDEEISKVWMTT